MNALIRFFRTKPGSWDGCRPLTAAERMARYSVRHAEDMRQRENAGAGLTRVRVVEDRLVLVALPGRVNHLPNRLPDESASEYEARVQALRAERLAALPKDHA